jgi:hypothetical protein
MILKDCYRKFLNQYADIKIIWRGEEYVKSCSREEGREYGSWSLGMWKLTDAYGTWQGGQGSICGEGEDERCGRMP